MQALFGCAFLVMLVVVIAIAFGTFFAIALEAFDSVREVLR